MKRVGVRGLIISFAISLVLLVALAGQVSAQPQPEIEDPEAIRACIDSAFAGLVASLEADPFFPEGGRFARAVADCVSPVLPPG
jgi:hypothetical protein